MSAWIDSMSSPTSGKRASVRSGCRDATRIENSHSSKCWTTWRPRKPVPPNTVTFPRAIVPFPRRCPRHMDDLHCALEDQEPSLFKRTIGRMKAGIDELEEANIILRRLNHDA